MKRIVYAFAVIFAIGLTSCKETKKAESADKAVSEEIAVKGADLAHSHVYQCPMDCEKGKSYDKEGACPVCKMDMKAKDVKSEGKKCDADCEKACCADKKDGDKAACAADCEKACCADKKDGDKTACADGCKKDCCANKKDA